MVVVGCLAQIGKEKLEQIPEIDLILGNEDKKDIIRYVEEFDKNSGRSFVSDIMKYDKYNVEELSTLYEKTRAIVKIQDGCNNYCSYCIIPYARGKIRSKPFKDVMTEVNNIIRNGYKEIVLTGINLSSYHYGLENAVKTVANVDGIYRVRLGSLKPDLMTKELLLSLKDHLLQQL
jgi:threonylcarbamoyladenosine tRNA methylthiotransferase MtaB